eukprot:3800139-Rhodomonas_salina.1
MVVGRERGAGCFSSRCAHAVQYLPPAARFFLHTCSQPVSPSRAAYTPVGQDDDKGTRAEFIQFEARKIKPYRALLSHA